jgi:hypothetical protein
VSVDEASLEALQARLRANNNLAGSIDQLLVWIIAQVQALPLGTEEAGAHAETLAGLLDERRSRLVSATLASTPYGPPTLVPRRSF